MKTFLPAKRNGTSISQKDTYESSRWLVIAATIFLQIGKLNIRLSSFHLQWSNCHSQAVGGTITQSLIIE